MHYAIIAAGEGSRLRHEGIITPKPLLRIGGKTLIERLIDTFRSMPECETVSIIISPETKDYCDTSGLAAPWADADNVVTASTSGSMHSFHLLSPCLRDGKRFCLTTVDTVFRTEEFVRYIRASIADNNVDGYMAVTSYIDDEKPLYISAEADGAISGFFDGRLPGIRYVSGGIYTLSTHALDILDDCMEAGMTRMREYQRALIAAGMRLKAYPFSRIIDVDHAADIAKAEALLSP